ncbi:MAG: lysylphosphatidylglycerol synthase transmembrane domain-containing protein [Bacteroidota bacterium]
MRYKTREINFAKFLALSRFAISFQRLPWRLLNRVFQIGITLLLLVVLYTELSKRDQLSVLFNQFLIQVKQADLLWLFATLILLPFNWFMEAYKWRYFMQRYEPVSLKRAYAAVMVGVTFSLITPNRIGEFGGRLLFVQRVHQWKSISSNAVGGAAQYLVLLTGGLIGAGWLVNRLWTPQFWWPWLEACVVISLGLFYYFYFNPGRVLPILKKLTQVKWFASAASGLQLVEQLKTRDLWIILSWSAIRYLIYTTQYYFMLRFFGIKTDIWAAFSGISFIFMIQTILPVPAFAGLLLRGNLAVFVWSYFKAPEISSLASTFLLWIINLILPALVGTFLMFNVNISKTLGYEEE